MAFAVAGLSAQAANGNNTAWHYATNDTAAVVAGASYFDAAAAMVRVGDTIDASVDLDGSPGKSDFVVTAVTKPADERDYATGGAVTIALENQS